MTEPTDNKSITDRIVALFDQGPGPHSQAIEVLDDLVHETASSLASNANNGGIPGQVDFLRSNGWTEAEIEAKLKEAGVSLD